MGVGGSTPKQTYIIFLFFKASVDNEYMLHNRFLRYIANLEKVGIKKGRLPLISLRNCAPRMSADACLHHPWLQGPGAFVVLPTGALRRWVARRRWRGVGRAIGAVKRMTGLVGRRRAATQPSPPARTQPSASSPRPASTCSGTHNLYEGESCDTGERSSQWPPQTCHPLEACTPVHAPYTTRKLTGGPVHLCVPQEIPSALQDSEPGGQVPL